MTSRVNLPQISIFMGRKKKLNKSTPIHINKRNTDKVMWVHDYTFTLTHEMIPKTRRWSCWSSQTRHLSNSFCTSYNTDDLGNRNEWYGESSPISPPWFPQKLIDGNSPPPLYLGHLIMNISGRREWSVTLYSFCISLNKLLHSWWKRVGLAISWRWQRMSPSGAIFSPILS